MIKGIEGLIVGVLFVKLRKLRGITRYLVTTIIAIISALIIGFIGVNYYSGRTILSFSGLNIANVIVIPPSSMAIIIPQYLWIILAIGLGALVLIVGTLKTLEVSVALLQ